MTTPATRQITSFQDGNVPEGYTVKDAEEFVLASARATFDGSAAGAFLPAVEVYSPAGILVSRNVGSQVAAGGSADVTFAPFLRGAVQSSGGGVTAQTASYQTGTVSIGRNVSGNLPLSNPPFFGSDLFDRTVPAAPTVLVAGVYTFSCTFRCVIALGGAQTAGTSFVGGIIAGGGHAPQGFFTWPSGGTFVPAVTCTFIPVHLAAGTTVTFPVTNSDSAVGNHVYDSPGLSVTLLS